METELRSLNGTGKMPMPDLPVVKGYGQVYVGIPHDIRLFPAVIRNREPVRPEVFVEGGHSTCYFHPKLPTVAICAVSGRLICDLCATEWNGQTVSMESLQSLLDGKDSPDENRVQIRWDSLAITMAVLPLIFWFVTIITAPIALGICIFKWRLGPTGFMMQNRWRYWIAAILALAQITGWVLLFTGLFAEIL